MNALKLHPAGTMNVQEFFDPATFTLTYVVFDSSTNDAVLIDTVLDFNPASGKLSTKSIDHVLSFVAQKSLKLHFVLETHAHADHLTAAQIVKQKFPSVQIAIGQHITKVQDVFKPIFHMEDSILADGRDFDLLLKEGTRYDAGSLSFEVLHTPGHTPACSSYIFGDALFVGDAMFMPEAGTGRCDFPAGSADALYQSIQKIYALPDATHIFVGHDYPKDGQPPRFKTTIEAEKAGNIQLNKSTSRDQYVALRTARDKTLDAPRLLLPSIQVNIAAGKLPRPEANGRSYLRTPLNWSP